MSEHDEKRFSISMSADHHKRLAGLAKEYQLTQGEIVEILIDMAGKPKDKIIEAFTVARQAKVEGRTSLHAQMMRQRQARKAGK